MSLSSQKVKNSDAQNTQILIDLESLESSLRRTKAVGFVKKLQFKSEIEGLIGEMNHFHRGQSPEELDNLENRFNHLVNGIQSLVKTRDPELSKSIARLRNDLWKQLADPDTFLPTFGT